jgi:hypothetical protein
MADRKGESRERILRDRLRREVVNASPAFSEAFHRRILTAVEQSRAIPDDAPIRRAIRPRRRSRLPALLAAACVLIAVWIGWPRGGQGPLPDGRNVTVVAPPSVVIDAADELPQVDALAQAALEQLDELVAVARYDAAMSDLADDARLAVETISQPFTGGADWLPEL